MKHCIVWITQNQIRKLITGVDFIDHGREVAQRPHTRMRALIRTSELNCVSRLFVGMLVAFSCLASCLKTVSQKTAGDVEVRPQHAAKRGDRARGIRQKVPLAPSTGFAVVELFTSEG